MKNTQSCVGFNECDNSGFRPPLNSCPSDETVHIKKNLRGEPSLFLNPAGYIYSIEKALVNAQINKPNL